VELAPLVLFVSLMVSISMFGFKIRVFYALSLALCSTTSLPAQELVDTMIGVTRILNAWKRICPFYKEQGARLDEKYLWISYAPLIPYPTDAQADISPQLASLHSATPELLQLL
jgi:hypothetical protein